MRQPPTYPTPPRHGAARTRNTSTILVRALAGLVALLALLAGLPMVLWWGTRIVAPPGVAALGNLLTTQDSGQVFLLALAIAAWTGWILFALSVLLEIPAQLRGRTAPRLAARLLAFWFDGHGMDDWYGGGPDFDAEVRALAGDWREVLRAQPAEAFLTDPDTALAAVILFDQVPRNIHRRQAEAFATDDLARAVARGIVAKGWDQSWPDERRQFAYLPFEHSENLEDQRRAIELFSLALDRAAPEDRDAAAEQLDYAHRHRIVIERFGRFPHRNEALGRPSSDAEIAFLREPGSSF